MRRHTTSRVDLDFGSVEFRDSSNDYDDTDSSQTSNSSASSTTFAGTESVGVPMVSAHAQNDEFVPVFHPYQFAKEFFYNYLPFLCLPVVLWVDGWQGAKARSFIPTNTFICRVLFLNMVFYAMNLFYFLFEFGSPDAIISPFEVLILNGCWLLKALITASKYAYVPSSEYAELNNPDVDHEAIMQKQVSRHMMAWTEVKVEQIVHQFCTVSMRKQMRMECSSFKFASSVKGKQLNSALSVALSELERAGFGRCSLDKLDGDGVKTVSARTLAVQLILDGNSRFNRKIYYRGMMAFGLLHVLTPMIVRGVTGQYVFGQFWYQYFYTIGSIPVFTLHFVLNLLYMNVALFDFHRRQRVQQMLNQLISTGYQPIHEMKKKVCNFMDTNIVLSFTFPRNITNWLLLRQALHDFGKEFYYRLTLLSFFTCAYLAGLVACVAVDTFQFSGALDPVAAWLVATELLVYSAVLAKLVFLGSQNNEMASKHLQSLLKQKLYVRNSSIHKPHMKPRLVHCENLIDTAIKTVEIDADQHPVTILGIRAGSTLGRVILTLGGSAAALGLSYMFERQ